MSNEVRRMRHAIGPRSSGSPGGGGPVAWADVTGKPTTFPPTLPIAANDVTGLTAALASKADASSVATALNAKQDSLGFTPYNSTNPAGYTANSTDAALRDRSTHTGAQAISTVTGLQTALDAKQAAGSYLTSITGGMVTTALGYTPTSVTGLTGQQTVASFKTGLSLVKADVGLSNVDNTADSAKPVSTAQQTALNLKANIASPQFTGTAFFAQPTPTSKTATATLTIAELLTLILNVSGTAAKTLTLPTGTLTDAGLVGGALPVNTGFEWYIINTGTSTGAITMAGGTNHTYVGATGIAIGTSARFLTVKTATNTFTTYRIG